MKYSGLYNQKAEKYLSEVVFEAPAVFSKLKEFFDYAGEAVSKGKQIVIRVENELTSAEFSQLKRIYKAFPANIQIEFFNSENDIFGFLSENKIPFFYIEPAQTFEEILQYIADGVSQVKIANELSFSLVDVAKICHAAGVQVKVFANVLQSAEDVTPPATRFFIRPEDVSLYEEYADTLMLLYTDTTSALIPKVYAEDHKWFGDYSEIILNMPSESGLDGRYIIEQFGKKRLNCGRKCIKGSNCNQCNEICSLSLTLKEKNLLVRPTPKIKT